MVWLWVVAGAAVWLVLGVLLALTIGRGIRSGDVRSPYVGLPAGFSTADLPVALRAPVRPQRGLSPSAESENSSAFSPRESVRRYSHMRSATGSLM